MCGGTGQGGHGRGQHQGLSPRVRGNRVREIAQLIGGRSIPACAGEPSMTRHRPAAARVYPRVCGGTMRPDARWRRPSGLSPRVRGNLLVNLLPLMVVRSIPACAGEPGGGQSGKKIKGSIPACAGEPSDGCRRSGRAWVYPRVCGGTVSLLVGPAARAGLSPRVRGNHSVLSWRPVRSGSIPACAGEPYGQALAYHIHTVYPRVCGGTIGLGLILRATSGLSPRVRGNPTHLVTIGSINRSIPACAGEPMARKRSHSECTVYPRVCGGTGTKAPSSICLCGLSPRVRGNPAPSYHQIV